jgi:hypothetical protein
MLRLHEDARNFCRGFFDWYNQDHHHAGIGLMTPAWCITIRWTPSTARELTVDQAFRQNPGRLPKTANPAHQTNRRMDQSAAAEKPDLNEGPDDIERLATPRRSLAS